MAELAIAEGISIVWCALLGLSAHSHLSPAWHPGAAPPSVAEVVCAAAAASVGLTLLCYYGRTAPPSSTLAHLIAIAAGFGAGAAAHRWPVAALSGASAVAAVALVTALGLRCRLNPTLTQTLTSTLTLTPTPTLTRPALPAAGAGVAGRASARRAAGERGGEPPRVLSPEPRAQPA